MEIASKTLLVKDIVIRKSLKTPGLMVKEFGEMLGGGRLSSFSWNTGNEKNQLETLKSHAAYVRLKQRNNVVGRDDMRHHLVLLVHTHIGESIRHLVSLTE